MKAFLQTAALVILSTQLSAQSLEVSTNSSGGSILASTSVSVQYSIGQSFVNLWTDSEYQIQEGIFNGAINELVSAVEDFEIEVLKLDVYPNPSSDFIVLNERHVNESGTVRISSLDGVTLKQTEYRSGDRLPIQDLFPGTYFVELISNKTRKVSQLIKL